MSLDPVVGEAPAAVGTLDEVVAGLGREQGTTGRGTAVADRGRLEKNSRFA